MNWTRPAGDFAAPLSIVMPLNSQVPFIITLDTSWSMNSFKWSRFFKPILLRSAGKEAVKFFCSPYSGARTIGPVNSFPLRNHAGPRFKKDVHTWLLRQSMSPQVQHQNFLSLISRHRLGALGLYHKFLMPEEEVQHCRYLIPLQDWLKWLSYLVTISDKMPFRAACLACFNFSIPVSRVPSCKIGFAIVDPVSSSRFWE